MAESEKSIGGIWVNEKEGKGKWLNIQVDIEGQKYKLIAFKNRYKEGEKHPDYKIFFSRPKKDEEEAF